VLVLVVLVEEGEQAATSAWLSGRMMKSGYSSL
jgi:hypothetical protein